MALIFVDCEAWGGCPATGGLTEFGAVSYESYRDRKGWVTYHGVITKSKPSETNPAVPVPMEKKPTFEHEQRVYSEFLLWLKQLHQPYGAPIFVSDNPAFDWQWVNDGFHRTLGYNPFGHSARRIGDFYAGLMNDFKQTQKWKRLRITKHSHHPVEDAMGNVEAFARLLRGER